MYIAKGYFDTKFKKSFKRGDVVPNEIAEQYLRYVTKDGDKELLVETPTAVEVIVEEEVKETEEPKETEEVEEVKEVKETKKGKKKGFWN
jgi:hypothetical protein